MSQTISCIIMRGGTSRGPYLLSSDLPIEREACAELLLKIMGSGHELQLDGIGGGNSLTSKVAIVGPSKDDKADVDYLFAQVGILDKSVDFSPNCGNMLAGVGPFSIETGLIKATEEITTVRIRNINTNKIIHAQVLTPDGKVQYAGNTLISGAPNPGAPIKLTFLDVQGAKTGKLLPTGNKIDIVQNIPVTCIDAATPVILIRAQDLNKTGYEKPWELDADIEFMNKLESIRQEAGKMMGIENVANSVIPKPILLSESRSENSCLNARYFVPNKCHKALAVTGSIAIVTACCLPDTLASMLANASPDKTLFKIEHPSGFIELEVTRNLDDTSQIHAVSLIRTARKILTGTIHLP